MRYIVTVWIDDPRSEHRWDNRSVRKSLAPTPEVLKAEIQDAVMRVYGVDAGVEFGPVSEKGWGK